nr:hypothetical protein [uncultured Glaciecola sp.]
MRSIIQVSNIVYFIGGGADKTRERFGIIKWGPTNLMGAAKATFDIQKGPHCESKYYGYLDKKKIIQDIVKQKLKSASVRINLVGHSRGGAVAKDVAMRELRKLNIKANIVVSLDPVKAKRSSRYRVPSKKSANNVKTYICVYANPIKRDPTDYIAMVGGQYGARLQPHSHFFVEADINHGQPMPMLKLAMNDKGRTIWQVLLKESRKS